MRIRTIKPEFWSDELIASWPHVTRLAYISLWNESDDEGRLRANPLYLKAHLFPYDATLDMEKTLAPIVKSGRLVLYQIDGQSYGFLPHFVEHQVINRPAPSRLPSPPDVIVTDASVMAHVADTEASGMIPGLLPVGSVRTPPGREGKGKERSVFTESSGNGFSDFWSLYPKPGRSGRIHAERAWRKLTTAEREKALKMVSVYAASGRVADGFVKHAQGWLNGKMFDDDPAAWKGSGNGKDKPAVPWLGKRDLDERMAKREAAKREAAAKQEPTP